MSVRLFNAWELGNVARFLGDRTHFPEDRFRVFSGLLADVSAANVAEFMETYMGRHGTPEPLTAQRIREEAPVVPDEEAALDALRFFVYNTHTGDKELRFKAVEAAAALLTAHLFPVEQTA